MGEVLRKFSKNQVMEIYGSVSFRKFPLVRKVIYGSVSEAGELGLSDI